MPILADTSALYALLDADDRQHHAARDWFTNWAETRPERLLTHSYVVIETAALVQRRLGQASTRTLLGDLLPALDLMFIDQHVHQQAESAYLAAPSGPSLVDCVSFQLMRAHGMRQAFAFDGHFTEQGLEVVP